MSYINIKVDQSIIKTNLNEMISHSNKEAIVNLIAAMLEESVNGSKVFIKYLLGKEELTLPSIGSVGKFEINAHYVSNRDLLLQSPHNLNGFVTCVVTEHSGLHSYAPIKVEFPSVNSNGASIKDTTSLDLESFIKDPDDDFEIRPF